ncbi:MAG: TonB family protein [Candidatus Omnitrophica bacterium]|nr:TonB family protein [Candidatus Omnitrophota bacterium]
MRKARAFLIILSLFLLPGRELVFSQETKKAAISSSEETLYQGELKSISVNTPTRVVIGKPEIADILSVSTKEIVVVGKGAGSTNLIWWDEKGEHHTSLKVLTEAMAYVNARIKDLLKELNLSQISTEPSDSEGKVLLLGSVKTKEDMERVKTALGGLFARTTNLIQIEEEKAIIELEVEIIEVDKGYTKQMGMDWILSGGSVLLTEPPRWDRLADVPNSLFRVSEWTHQQLEATLNLMVKDNKAKILSRPKLSCQSGKEAELLVGGEKPVMTTQSVSGSSNTSNTVEYKEYGIKLKMSPSLNSDGKIKLGLNVEVSDVGTAEVLGLVTAPTAKAWPISKRSTSTQLYLNNGQTLAISGLIKQKTEEDLKKFPWLGEVPILGVFFRHRTTIRGGGEDEMGDTELVIMVTPSVVEDKGPEKREAEKKNQIKPGGDKIADSRPEEGKEAIAPKIYSSANNKGVVVSQTKPFAGGQQGAAATGPANKQNRGVVVSQGKSFAGGRQQPVLAKSNAPVQNKGATVSPRKPFAEGQQEVLFGGPAEEYVQLVSEYLSNNIFYPWAAKQAELQGTVVLNLHLAKAGDLLDSNISDSSGYSVLDENTMSIARRIAPYPSFPRDISEQDLWVQIPIVYNLEQKR